jgi:nucleotide-binding universal stress UspA family protein
MNEFVVGVDGSDSSRMALRWAAGAGTAVGVPVHAVRSWIRPRSGLLPLAPEPSPDEAMDERTRQETAEFVTDTLGPSTPVTSQALRGLPAGALLRRITPDSALVLGSRGMGGFKGLLLGSASQECVEYADCPVVVVRTDHHLGEGDVILVGKDGSDGAQWALAWAHALAGVTGATVRAVHAWRSDVSERPPHVGEQLRSQAAGAVQGWTEQIGDDIDTEEVEGDPRAVLVDAAERLAPALTIVGRRGAGGLRSMRLGSTANHIVRHGSTNVAVVPNPDDEAITTRSTNGV